MKSNSENLIIIALLVAGANLLSAILANLGLYFLLGVIWYLLNKTDKQDDGDNRERKDLEGNQTASRGDESLAEVGDKIQKVDEQQELIIESKSQVMGSKLPLLEAETKTKQESNCQSEINKLEATAKKADFRSQPDRVVQYSDPVRELDENLKKWARQKKVEEARNFRDVSVSTSELKYINEPKHSRGVGNDSQDKSLVLINRAKELFCGKNYSAAMDELQKIREGDRFYSDAVELASEISLFYKRKEQYDSQPAIWRKDKKARHSKNKYTQAVKSSNSLELGSIVQEEDYMLSLSTNEKKVVMQIEDLYKQMRKVTFEINSRPVVNVESFDQESDSEYYRLLTMKQKIETKYQDLMSKFKRSIPETAAKFESYLIRTYFNYGRKKYYDGDVNNFYLSGYKRSNRKDING